MAKTVFEMLEETPAGVVAVVSSGEELIAVEIGFRSAREAERAVREGFPEAAAARAATAVGRQLAEYFGGGRRSFDLECSVGALGRFYARVLSECRGVPFGEVVTYGELAERAGSPRAARAVGQALKRNPCPIVIPCHRIVGARGPGGYSARGGLETKRAILEFEGVELGRARGA